MSILKSLNDARWNAAIPVDCTIFHTFSVELRIGCQKLRTVSVPAALRMLYQLYPSFIPASLFSLSCLRVCVYVYVCVCVCVCVCMCLGVCLYMCVYVCVFSPVYKIPS